MDYTKFGNTGLETSKIILGCMTYGIPDRGPHPWTLDEEKSRPIIKKALDLGINFFDTANVYSDGTSEEIVGRILKDSISRDEVIIATKLNGRMRKGPNGAGLSRKAVFAEIDHSLKRLGTDYVDLYQIHRFDPTTPIEETLEALHDIVKAGKVRYIGASSMRATQFAAAVYKSRLHGWTQFVSMQNYVNLLYREEERDMLPFCAEEKIAVIPWSPLARGRLTRDWDEKTERTESDVFGKTLYEKTAEADKKVVEKVAEVAKHHGVPRAQVALAWVLQKPGITAPIIGASKAAHLDEAIAALSLKLSPDEIAALEAEYVPHQVTGFA